MKSFTITIVGDTAHNVTSAEILEAAAIAEKAFAEVGLLVANLTTSVDIANPDRPKSEGQALVDLVKEIVHAYYPDKKIDAIKDLRSRATKDANGNIMGLKEAKDLIDQYWS